MRSARGTDPIVVTSGAGGCQTHYLTLARMPHEAGARTGLFVPELHRLCVAVPRRLNPVAEIRVFDRRLTRKRPVLQGTGHRQPEIRPER